MREASDLEYPGTKEGVIGIVKANHIIRLRERAHLLDAFARAGYGEDTCKGISHKNEEIRGKWVSLSKALTT